MLRAARSRLEEVGKVCYPESECIGIIVSDDALTSMGTLARQTSVALEAVNAPIDTSRLRGGRRHQGSWTFALLASVRRDPRKYILSMKCFQA